MSTLIQIFGGPSAGKSVMAADLYSIMSRSSRFTTVELVQEYAKELVWQERFDELKCQKLVTNGQISKLMPLNGKVDYLITDSPLLLGLVYAEDQKEVEDDILLNMARFDRVLSVFIDRGDSVFQTQGRVHNHQQSIEIDKKIKDMLKAYDYDFVIVNRDDATLVAELASRG